MGVVKKEEIEDGASQRNLSSCLIKSDKDFICTADLHKQEGRKSEEEHDSTILNFRSLMEEMDVTLDDF